MAFGANIFAMTGLMIFLSLIGKSELAADLAIVQASTSALFYAFSGNARNLILNQKSVISANNILVIRLALIIPLGIVSAILSIFISQVAWLFALILIIRRGSEWLADIYLSESEANQKQNDARNYTLFQCATLMLVCISVYAGNSYFYISLLIWSLFPLISCARNLNSKKQINLFKNLSVTKLLPHLGSTAVIGIGVYVFRLVILSLVDKPTAGDLFAAFAIGGIISSVFVQAIGPSIVAHISSINRSSLSKYFHVTNFIFALIGLIIVIFTWNKFDVNFIGKQSYFFEAIGYSLIGSALMIYAQYFRLKLLQEHENYDVYGPDVLINILFIVSVPFLMYIFGKYILSSLFFISSLINFIFYYFYHIRISKNFKSLVPYFSNKFIIYLISGIILIPVFLQINACISSYCVFNDKAILYDTNGLIFNLPIPLSIFACIFGMVLFNDYKKAKIALTVVFMLFIFMVISTVITTNNNLDYQQAKMIFMMQFIIPVFALILGQLMHSNIVDIKAVAKSFIVVVMIIVPSQLLLSWLDGKLFLVSYLYLFSFYQHIQYGGTIIIAAYIFSLFVLYKEQKYRNYLFILMPLIGIFSVASLSKLTIILYLLGIILFLFTQFSEKFNWKLFILFLISIGCVFYYFSYSIKNSNKYQDKYDLILSENIIDDIKIDTRSYYWQYYLKGLLENKKTKLFGHGVRPDRDEYPSAHNYYLDLSYNYGILALLPIAYLLFYTIYLTIKNRELLKLSPSIIGVIIVVYYILIVDNFFKVGLRQPYSGVFTFFVWGLFLSVLNDLKSQKRHFKLDNIKKLHINI